jgi:hypothetical protein
MAATVNKLAEQIQRIFAKQAHQENLKPTLNPRELHPLIEQSINAILKVRTQEKIAEGFIEVPKCSIVEYANIAVVASGTRSYFVLPIMPIDLPNDMGVWAVSPSTDPFITFIPLPAQSGSVMVGTDIEFLEGQVGYFRSGSKVWFTKDVTTVDNGVITTVNPHLLVNDMSQYQLDDPLPLSADYEILVIESVLKAVGMLGYNQINTDADKNNR